MFYAVYHIHKYKMHYIDGDGNEIATAYVPSNSSIVNYTPNILPSKDDSQLELTKTYKHIGWALSPTGKVEEWTDKNIGRASKDRYFYAIFEEASVYENILDKRFLSFAVNNDSCSMSFNITTLKGKITLPKDDGNGHLVTSMARGSINQNISHIFFEPGCVINIFYPQTFQNFTNLKYIELPVTDFTLSATCFGSTSLFNSSAISQDAFDEFISKIGSIGNGCFSGINFGDKTLKLPGTITIGPNAFNSIRISAVQLGKPGDPFLSYDQISTGLFAFSKQPSGSSFPNFTVYYENDSGFNGTQYMAKLLNISESSAGALSVNFVGTSRS